LSSWPSLTTIITDTFDHPLPLLTTTLPFFFLL
jgi:hypothetical protein